MIPAPNDEEASTATCVPEINELKSALQTIPADDYDTWVKVGMALHSKDPMEGLGIWTEWSKGSPKYRDECEKKWQSFHCPSNDRRSLTVATIFALAKENGWFSRSEQDNFLFARLATMSPMQYDRVREDEAKKAGVRVATLDSMVEAHRRRNNEADKTGPVIPADPEPWPDPVDGPALLDEIAKTYRRFVVLPDHGAIILALWTVHTYIYDKGHYSPIIACISPVKRCGKSITLRVAAGVAQHPQCRSSPGREGYRICLGRTDAGAQRERIECAIRGGAAGPRRRP